MNAGEELISIIVPVYNAGNYIEETIHMVEKQTYRTWELILVDDHSADDSRKIIENYLDRREKEQRDKDSEAGEIRLITKDENEGAARARNTGIDAAKGRYIAFLDADDIWMTDKQREQVYDNNAGIMMDRNLGATSATPDDITSFGLLYQWGRKDPFRGAGELVSAENGKSSLISTTAKWPDAVVSDKTTGTIEYAVSHPMTFIIENSNNSDWFYTDEWDSDDTRWQSGKTVYDPCPAGWRVPDGGSDGIWARAMGITDDYFESTGGWDTGHSGVDFSKTDKPLATGETVWYPYEGLIYSDSGNLSLALDLGGYWSVTKRSHYGYVLAIMKYDQAVMPYLDSPRAHGCSVRCMKVR